MGGVGRREGVEGKGWRGGGGERELIVCLYPDTQGSEGRVIVRN